MGSSTNVHCVEHDTQVLKLNGTRIKNIHHLAHLVYSSKGKYLVFVFEDNILVVLEREEALSASILKDYGIPAERSSDLLGPYVDSTIEQSEATITVIVQLLIQNLAMKGFFGLDHLRYEV